MDKRDKQFILEAQIKRGEEAKAIFENVLQQETFAAMERDILSTMKRLKPNDVESRDVCWRELRALERHKAKYKNYLFTGEVAKKSLAQLIRGVFKPNP